VYPSAVFYFASSLPGRGTIVPCQPLYSGLSPLSNEGCAFVMHWPGITNANVFCLPGPAEGLKPVHTIGWQTAAILALGETEHPSPYTSCFQLREVGAQSRFAGPVQNVQVSCTYKERPVLCVVLARLLVSTRLHSLHQARAGSTPSPQAPLASMIVIFKLRKTCLQVTLDVETCPWAGRVMGQMMRSPARPPPN
jgi:hypothetical protein